MSSLHPLHRQAAQHFYQRVIYNQSESFLRQPEQTFGSLGTELWEPNIYIWVFFFESSINLQVTSYKLPASYLQDFYKLQLLFMYSFTHINLVFLFNHLPTEILIFKNVFY